MLGSSQRAEAVARYFERLGDRVDDEWRATSYDDRRLPEIAARALAEDPPHESVRPGDVVRWVLAARSLGPQPNGDSRFGQPPVTVYAGRRFYIEVLFWFDGTTEIHQHSFDGAFAVLAGSSVHSTYDFHEHARTSTRLLVGDVAHRSSEMLRRGDVRAIRAGRSFIHSLFHMDRPSVSVVVRSPAASDAGVQYQYVPPYVAVDAFDKDLWNRRATDFIDVAFDMRDPQSADLLLDALRNSDDLGAYRLIARAFRHAADEPAAQDDAVREDREPPTRQAMRSVAIEGAHERFGALANPILQSLEEAGRRGELVAARSAVHDPHHRFFLAVLMNVPRRSRVLDLVGEQYPGTDPVTLIHRWLGELTAESSPLVSYAIGDDALALVESALRDMPFEGAVARLSARHGRPLEPREMEDVKVAWQEVRSVPLLRPLFTEEVPAGRR